MSTSLLISVLLSSQIRGTPLTGISSTDPIFSANSATLRLPLNGSDANSNVYCHKSLGEHLAAQLPDCRRVLGFIQTHDIKDVGVYAIFSWDSTVATRSTDNIYVMPQTIVRGNCRAIVRLNGVKSVRALWGVGVRDAFDQLMKTCIGKYDIGGFTFAQRTGNGLRVTLGNTSGDDVEGSGPGEGFVVGADFPVLSGDVPTS